MKKESRGDEVPTVLFVPIRCPFCGSVNKRTYSRLKYKALRYHTCKECFRKFKSVEDDEPPEKNQVPDGTDSPNEGASDSDV